MGTTIRIQGSGRIKHSESFTNTAGLFTLFRKCIITDKPTYLCSFWKSSPLVFTIFIDIMQLHTLSAFYADSGFRIGKHHIFPSILYLFFSRSFRITIISESTVRSTCTSNKTHLHFSSQFIVDNNVSRLSIFRRTISTFRNCLINRLIKRRSQFYYPFTIQIIRPSLHVPTA